MRVGAAAGSEGPRIFLLACKKLRNSSFKIGQFKKVGPRVFLLACKKLKNSSFKIGNFEKVHGAPPFSHAVPTPNAYMTDEVWEAIAEPLAKGI